MSEDYCFLITILYGESLLECALKVKRKNVGVDVCQHPMEPENRKVLHGLLPLHVQTCGPIVEVRELFEIHDAA